MAHIVLVQDVSKEVFEIMMFAIENNISMEEVVVDAAELVMSAMQIIACTDSLCNGTTKQGVNCKNKVGKGEMYCRFHNDQHIHCPKRVDANSRTLCFGITKKGHLCKKVASTKFLKKGYCYIHQYTQQTIEERPSVRAVETCTSSTKKGHYCKGKVQHGKTKCFFHNKAIGKTCLGVTEKGMCRNIIHGKNARGNYCMFHVNEYYKYAPPLCKIETDKVCVNASVASKLSESLSPPLSEEGNEKSLVPEYKSSTKMQVIERMFLESVHHVKNKYIPTGSEQMLAHDSLSQGRTACRSSEISNELVEQVDASRRIPSKLRKGYTRITAESGGTEESALPEDYGEREFPVPENMYHVFAQRLNRKKIEIPKAALPMSMIKKIQEQNFCQLASKMISLSPGSPEGQENTPPLRGKTEKMQPTLPGNLSLDELLNATFVHKDDRKRNFFNKEALEELRPREILIGAYCGSYKRVKLEEFEENLDTDDICSMFEVYVKGVRQKDDETLDIYREKVRKLND